MPHPELVKWVSKGGNPFARPNELPPEKPDTKANMRGFKHLSELDLPLMNRSTLLGSLLGVKFWPWCGPLGWGALDPKDVEKLETFAMAKLEALKKQEYEHRTMGGLPDMRTKEQKQEVADFAIGMSKFNSLLKKAS